MALIPSIFSSNVAKKCVSQKKIDFPTLLTGKKKKYGDVFTFVLFGRHMTVALGSKGNNFILGGKSTHFSAEEAYTVRVYFSLFCPCQSSNS
jgi:hypothetical protein